MSGILDTQMHYDGQSAPASLYIVESGSLLLGLDLTKALDIVIVGNRVILKTEQKVREITVLPPPVTEASSPPATTAPPPPTMGCVKGFVHKVKVREDVKPVQQKLRRLPFAVRDAVSAELKRLLDVDIIEKIDASPWVSPIVVTQRKNSSRIRMCSDLREPNKAVVTDSYPIPHMEELFSELRGATIFSTIDLANAVVLLVGKKLLVSVTLRLYFLVS